jgi:murein L,D-transpeptidase YcbB/YkuD
MFFETMTHVVLGPYWNIPHSIVVNEILPIVLRDPGYLERAHLAIVDGETDGSPIVPPTPQALARLRAGTLRLRQQPGPDNALGSIKFVFPSERQVVLHGTPARGVFAAPRRDVSHGCIRVEDPIALAAWALRGVEEWPADVIARTAPSAVSVRVELVKPVRVLAYYLTAAVAPDDGLLHFAEDVYGWDRALDRALRDQR